MSLEAILEANTAALQSHTAVMQALLERLGAGGALAVPASVTAQTGAELGKTLAAAELKTDAPATDAKTDAKTADTKTADITYDQIKPLILKVNTTKGRDAATSLLAEFGVTRGPELKPEQFAAFHKRATEVLA